jgi:uncharacterized RDD family membrane protein YckC
MQFHPKDLSELDELTEEHLGFSALSDGLGFAKNSKKVPVKPAADFDSDPLLQKKALSGTGAVAAGPARPVLPQKSIAAQATPAPATRTAPAPAVQNVLAEPAAPRADRVAAFFLDLAFVFVPLAAAWYFAFGDLALETFQEDRRPPLMLFGAIFAVYFLLSESFGGQSLGKMALGLRVVEDDKYQKPTGFAHAVKRLALFAAGAVFFGLGFLASFWDVKRRPWHDRYSGSIVRKHA